MIDTKTYWNERYASGGNSGYGSYNEQVGIKLDAIKKHIGDPKDILDIGCGDFAFSQKLCDLYPDAFYFGQDISDVIIEENKKKYPHVSFTVYDPQKPLVPAELVVCIDVIFHFGTKEEQEALLDQLEKAWTKYLVLTSVDSQNDVSRFGTPIARVIIEAHDAYIYIWKK